MKNINNNKIPNSLDFKKLNSFLSIWYRSPKVFLIYLIKFLRYFIIFFINFHAKIYNI